VSALGKVIRFADWPVRRKLIALVVAASMVPLAVAATLDIRAARARLREASEGVLAARGDQLRAELDAFHRGHQRAIGLVAALPTVVAVCAAAGEEVVVERAAARAALDAYVAADDRVVAAGVLDRTGRVVTATKPALVGRAWGGRAGVGAVLAGQPAAPVVGQADASIHDPAIVVVEYLAPVTGAGGPVGAVVAWVRIEALWAETRRASGLAGTGSVAVVVDELGIRLAPTSLNDRAVFHPTAPLSAGEAQALIDEQRFGDRTATLVREVEPYPALATRARAAAPDGAMFRGFGPLDQAWNDGVARRLTSAPWTVFYLVPEATVEARLADATTDKLVLAGAIIAAALALGLGLAAAIRRPLVALADAAAAIGAGDRSARVPVGGADEVGQLCASFNDMAARIERDAAALRRSRDELEHRVAERTAALAASSQTEAAARQALEHNAARLALLADTAHALAASSGDAEAVLALTAQRLGEQVGDGCVVRLLSDDRAWIEPTRCCYHPDPAARAILEAALGDARQPAGDGAIGRAATSGVAQRIAAPTADEVAGLWSPGAAARAPIDALGVTALLVVPLRSRDRTIGVVALLRGAGRAAYTADDERFAHEIADRAGLAIDNAVLVATLERRVAARAAALEAANQELEAFSESVAHELRGPLRAIEGFSDAVLSEHVDQLDEPGRRYLQRIRAATQRGFTLIDDMLNLARITRLELRWVRVDLSAIAAQVAAELRRRDPARTTPIHVAPGLACQGDARLLAIAIENLVRNAWKFTAKRPDAEIWVGSELRDGAPVFFVRDTGAGFDMRYGGQLFRPFQRLHGSAEFEGVGVGLATVHRIVARHGGRIWAEGAVDQGATFSFVLGDAA
jgi:signal transduction histidine kinase